MNTINKDCIAPLGLLNFLCVRLNMATEDALYKAKDILDRNQYKSISDYCQGYNDFEEGNPMTRVDENYLLGYRNAMNKLELGHG